MLVPLPGVAPKVKPAGAGAVVFAAVPLPNVCVVLAPQVTAIAEDKAAVVVKSLSARNGGPKYYERDLFFVAAPICMYLD